MQQIYVHILAQKKKKKKETQQGVPYWPGPASWSWRLGALQPAHAARHGAERAKKLQSLPETTNCPKISSRAPHTCSSSTAMKFRRPPAKVTDAESRVQ